MKKLRYKLHFKAHDNKSADSSADSFDSLKEAIRNHFTEQGLTIHEYRIMAEVWGIVIRYPSTDVPTFIRFNLKDKTAEHCLWISSTQRFDSERLSAFKDSELEFLDKLGFDLTESQKKQTGQSIEDWWSNKALDELTLKAQILRIVETFKTIGYKFNKLITLNANKKTFKELTDLSKLKNIRKENNEHVLFLKNDKNEKIKFTLGLKLVEKDDASSALYVDFTNEELKLIDSLDFDLAQLHKTSGNQSSADWFKALDAVATLEEGLIELGYTLLNAGSDIQRWVNGGFTIFIYPSDKEADKSYKTAINSLPKAVEFTDRELYLLDSFNYKLTEWFTTATKQTVENWWSKKANDQLTKIELIKLILAEVKNLGYRFNWLGLYKGKRIIVGAEELNKTLDELPEDFDDFLALDLVSDSNSAEVEEIRLNFENMTIDKLLQKDSRVRAFTNEELKFFDSLGFKTSGYHKEMAKQEIEDWYLKGLDRLTKIELIKLILAKLKSLGYMFASLSLDREKYEVIRSEELLNKTLNELPEDSNDLRLLSVISEVGEEKEVINVYFTNMTIDKMLNYKARNFTNEELKFFDSLGFKLSPWQRRKTNQEIEDWYLKANDELTKIELVKLILAKLKNLGYSFNWLSLYREKYITIRTEEELNRTLKELPEDFEDFETLDLVSDSNPDKAEEIIIHFEDMTTSKISQRYFTVENFTNEELKFFDSLGFKLSKRHKMMSNQEIEDWYLKGLDQLTKIELVRLIITKLKSFGYRFNWLSLYKKKRIVINTEEELNKTLDELPEDFDNFEALDLVSGSNLAAAEQIRLDFKNVTAVKKLLNHITPRNFTNEELKFFDSLGFNLSDRHKRITDQDVEDWYLKAKDQLTKLELLRFVIAKLKSLGYRFNWLSLTKEEYTVIRSEKELDKILKESPEDFEDFYKLNMVSGADWNKIVEIEVRFKSMTIEKTRENNIKPVDFTNEELKFFDSLGFDLSGWQRHTSPQQIEDWYLKAKDQLTEFELLRLVMAKLKSLGYRFNWLGLYRGKYITVNTEEELNKTLDELPEDFEDLYRLNMVSETDSNKRVEIEVHLKNMTIEKTLNNKASNFTNEELKLFDLLGFDLSKWQKMKSPQQIEDWYLKGLDELPAWQILRIMERKMKDLGYDEAVVTTDEAVFDNPKNLSDYTDEELKEFADDIVRVIFYSSDAALVVHIRGMLGFEKDKKISKYKINTSTFALFTNEELKLFDSLGYTIVRHQRVMVRGKSFKQDITDWYTGGSDEKI